MVGNVTHKDEDSQASIFLGENVTCFGSDLSHGIVQCFLKCEEEKL